MVNLKKGSNSFTLVGKMKITPNTFTLDAKAETGTGFISNRAYIGVDCGRENTVYVQMYDGYYDGKKIYAVGKKPSERIEGAFMDDYTQRITVDWKDRTDPSILSKIGPRCFTEIGLEVVDNKVKVYRFLSDYDAVRYLSDYCESLSEEERKNLVVTVKGELEYSYYNDKVTLKKNVRSIKRADVSESEYRSEFTQTIYVNKDSILDEKEEGFDAYSAYVPEYISKINKIPVKKTVLLPRKFICDIPAKANYFNNNLPNYTNYARMTVIGRFIEMGSTASIDMSDLSKEERERVEAGLMDITKLVATGERRKEYMTIDGFAVASTDGPLNGSDVLLDAYTTREVKEIVDDFYDTVGGTGEVPGVEMNKVHSEKPQATIETPVSDDDLFSDIDIFAE